MGSPAEHVGIARVLRASAAAKAGAVAVLLFAAVATVGPQSFVPLAAARPTERVGSGGTSEVRLVTGDMVQVATAGVVVRPAQRRGIAGEFQTLRLGTSTYVIPAAARPYLGRYLDPGLFDVTRLAASSAVDQPMGVRITLEHGIRADLPGVTITGRSSSTETGYFTTAGADTFRRALDAQWRFDAHHGWPSHSALFAAIAAIAPVGAATAAGPETVRPAFAQVTLSLRVLDGQGRPVPFTSVALMNTDDARRYVAFPPVVDGLAKVSVPLGNYSALATVDEFDPHTQAHLTSRTVAATDYRVRRAGQTLVLDARTATSRPSVHTPRPAGRDLLLLSWARLDQHGATGLSALNGYEDPHTLVLVSPAPPARVGLQHWVTEWTLQGSPAHGLPYTYDLVFDDPDIASDQARVVRNDQIATVHARYYADGQPRISLFARGPVLQYQGGYQLFPAPLTAPQVRTEYVVSPPGVRWSAVLLGDATTSSPAIADGLRRYPAGSHSRADWLRPALMPGFAGPTPADRDYLCPACRAHNQLSLQIAAVTDSTPSHAGSPDEPPHGARTARLRIYRDGRLLADENNIAVALVPASARKATYRLLFQLDRGATGALLSTRTRTDLTFRSSARQGRAIPANWTCTPTDPQPEAGCAALPLLEVRAPLPVDLNGELPWGRHPLGVTVSHAPGAAAIPITRLVVATSTDGAMWRRAPIVQQSDGRYRAQLVAEPASAGLPVALRITARDAAGGTLRQTIRAAYTIAQS